MWTIMVRVEDNKLTSAVHEAVKAHKRRFGYDPNVVLVRDMLPVPEIIAGLPVRQVRWIQPGHIAVGEDIALRRTNDE